MLVGMIAASVVSALGVVIVAAWLWPQAGGVATCLNTRCFCEAARGGLMKQPINTLSSLAYVVVAAYAWLRLRYARTSRVFQGFIASMVIIGLGSAYYHAKLSFAGQWLDVLGMYLFATLMICATLLRANIVSKKLATTLFVAFNITLGILQFTLPDTRRYLFALLIIVALALEFTLIKHNQNRKHLYQALALMVAAYAVWLLDQSLTACAPTSLIQGHAIWHILGAIAAYCVVLRYHSGDTTKGA